MLICSVQSCRSSYEKITFYDHFHFWGGFAQKSPKMLDIGLNQLEFIPEERIYMVCGGLRARLRRLLLGSYIVHVHGYTGWNWWPLPVLLILSMSALGSCILTCHVGFLEAGFAVLQILLSKSRKSECLWASDFRGKINRFSLILNRQPCASYTFIVHLNVTSGCSTVARIELLPYEVRWSAVNMYSTRLTLITSKV